jgi:hypothetical protein
MIDSVPRLAAYQGANDTGPHEVGSLARSGECVTPRLSEWGSDYYLN